MLISLYFISNLSENWLFKLSKKCSNSLLAWRNIFHFMLQFSEYSSSVVHYYIGLWLTETIHKATLKNSEKRLIHQAVKENKFLKYTASESSFVF